VYTTSTTLISPHRHSAASAAQATFATLCLVAALSMLAGCPGTGEKLADETYTQAYQQRNYDQALRLAEARAKQSDLPAGDKERAELVAGLAAYALQKPAVAITYLRPLISNNDRQVSGRASWTLGQIEAERGNHADAAKYLISAAANLDGDDAARASALAGDCYARLNMAEQAKDQYSKAQTTATDPALVSMLQQRLAGGTVPAISRPGTGGVPLAVPTGSTPKPTATGGFTVQLGAFERQEAATRLAQSALKSADRANAPAPQVVAITAAGGRTLYAVRVGDYLTREAAQAVLTRLGGKGAIVRK